MVMNFGYGMPMYGGYNFQQQPQQQTQGYGMQQTQGGDSRVWVQGEIGAKSYIIAPGNVVPLWDSESQTIWIKSVAANGLPAMQKLTYSYDVPQQPVQQQTVSYVTREELEKRLAEIMKVKEDQNHE